MKIATLSFLFGLFLCTTSNAMEINPNNVTSPTIENPSNPWVLEKLYVGKIVELKDIDFEMDVAALNEGSKESLGALGDFLKKHKSVKIEIRGHTNAIPSDDYCDKLSTERAQVVRQHLLSMGINPESIKATGIGKREPIASNYTAEGRKTNQRVDVKILAL